MIFNAGNFSCTGRSSPNERGVELGSFLLTAAQPSWELLLS